jgi:ribonuclease R
MALLRSMNQAVYQVPNEGHFGLGYTEYTHFTSPIRRFPDLLTHRYIKSVIHSREKSDSALRVGKINKTNFYPYDTEQVVTFGAQTSFTERRAESAVYEVLEWIKCDYISDRVGDILDGVITGVTKFGFFVELDRIFVEGLVHISTLVGDYYNYDQSTQCLTGERTHLTYGMGDTVQVQIVRVNVDERKVDFELISHSSLVSRRSTNKKQSKKGILKKGGSGKGRAGGAVSARSTTKRSTSRHSGKKNKRDKRHR